jgi:hypothetical protein
MSLEIRWAKPADAADLALILREMAAHYRQSPLTEHTAFAAAHKWLASEGPARPHFALARRGEEVAGLASVAIAHPGVDLERLLFLKDLFVRDGFRDASDSRCCGSLRITALPKASAASTSRRKTGTKAPSASTRGSARSATTRRFFCDSEPTGCGHLPGKANSRALEPLLAAEHGRHQAPTPDGTGPHLLSCICEGMMPTMIMTT